jgi:ppGpp synthetase/RelA/SpoT-type nucleotidyltranferase
MTTLTKDELGLIYRSLEYTVKEFKKYNGYPSEEFRKERVKEITDLMEKVSALIKA